MEAAAAVTNFLMRFRHRLFQLFFILCVCFSSMAFGRKLPDIQWHSSNTIFDISNTEHVKRVHLLDRVTLLCPPPAPDGSDPSLYEHSKLFMVSRESYDQCILQGTGTKQIGVCSSPERQSSITLVFRDVSPLPSAFTFRPGQSYFVITTSNGTLMGLNNTEGGLCATRNMRLKFDVLSLTDEADDAKNDSQQQTHVHANHHHHHNHQHHHHHQQRYHHHKSLAHKQTHSSSIQNESQYPPFLYVIHTSETSPHGDQEREEEEGGGEAAAWGQDSYETGDDTEIAYSSAASTKHFALIRMHCFLAVLLALITCWTNKIISR